MSETATRTSSPNTTNPILSPKVYWRVSAFALTAVALLGFAVNTFAGNETGITSFLVFDWVHNAVHVALAAVAFYMGFGNVSGQVQKTMAILFGFVYLGLGIVGFIGGNSFSLLGLLTLEIGENLVHVLLGAWALAAGFMARY